MKREEIEPFKNGSHMRKFEKELLLHGNAPEEVYMAWQVAKRCLLRISDVVSLKYNQIYNKNGQVHGTVVTHDQKTKKYNPLNLAPLVPKLNDYKNWRIVHHISSQWLFPRKNNPSKPLRRQYVYRLIKQSADLLGYKHISCHSARKTGAYILYMNTNNLAMVSHLLNHSNEKVTERYLGISDPAIKSATNATDWEDIPKSNQN